MAQWRNGATAQRRITLYALLTTHHSPLTTRISHLTSHISHLISPYPVLCALCTLLPFSLPARPPNPPRGAFGFQLVTTFRQYRETLSPQLIIPGSAEGHSRQPESVFVNTRVGRLLEKGGESYAHHSPLTTHLSPLTSHLSPLTSHLSPLISHLSYLLTPCSVL